MELVAPHCASHGHVGHYPKGVSVSRRRIRAWPMVMPLLLPQIPALSTRVRSLGSSDSVSASEFDTASYEAERKRLDSEARDNMKRAAEAQQSEPEAPGAWKWKIRKRVWDMLEAEGIARNPRPVHHRIPNFVGAEDAADKLGKLPAYRAANCVKVNPDTPQKPVRFMTLRAVKKLLTPQPRLRTGFFSTVDATDLSDGELIEASTTAGVAKFGKPVGLDAKLKVDLVVIGSVAVDPITGARLGKGEGFAELEYGMLRYMGAINDSTLVVTTVHDKQLVNDIPVEKLLIHDVPVDVICTPTQIIHTNRSIPKPTGIYWDRLSPEKLNQIRILQELKKKIEKETGTPLKLGPSEKLPPVAQRKNVSNPRGSGTESGIFIWNLDAKASRKDLKQHLMQLGISTNDIEIFKSGQDSSTNVARVMIPEGADIQWCINTIDNTQLNGVSVRARVDRSQPLRK